jgi:hypothetical protein
MANLLEQAINSDDGDRAARIILDALGIESDDVANYVFPKTWPTDRPHNRGMAADGSAFPGLMNRRFAPPVHEPRKSFDAENVRKNLTMKRLAFAAELSIGAASSALAADFDWASRLS